MTLDEILLELGPGCALVWSPEFGFYAVDIPANQNGGVEG